MEIEFGGSCIRVRHNDLGLALKSVRSLGVALPNIATAQHFTSAYAARECGAEAELSYLVRALELPSGRDFSAERTEPMRGTGNADVFVMLAHPVGHAKSPGIFNEIFEEKELDSLMVPLTCRPEDFETFWAGITAAENIRGVIISVPYKTIVYHKCATGHDRAVRVQSANSVRRQADGTWYADNFDGVGFIDALKANGHEIAGKRILQVGAGGAGSSIAYCLAEAGAVEIRLNDVERARASSLAQLVAKAFPACRIEAGEADPTGVDMAVNATPVGMHAGDPLPLDVSKLTPAMTVVDIIMEPAETALLRIAKEKGCKVQPGRPMMDYQVRGMSEFFDIERKGSRHG